METDTVIQCLQTTQLTETARSSAYDVLGNILTIQKHLSFTQLTNTDAYTLISKLSPYHGLDKWRLMVEAATDIQRAGVDTSLLHPLSEKIAAVLHSTDQSLICALIPYAQLSEAIAMAGTHHVLVGILGLSVFVKVFNTLSGSLVTFLKMIWYKLSFKLYAKVCCQKGIIFIEQNSVYIGATIFVGSMLWVDATGCIQVLKGTVRVLKNIESVSELMKKVLATGFIGSCFLKTTIAVAEAAEKLLRQIEDD